MKKIAFLFMLLGVFALSAFAQTATNFAGTWTLDTSKLDERRAATIKSQTITVTQDAAEIKATTATERNAPPAGGPPAGGGMGGGRGMGGGMGADGTAVYKLDGSEVTTERETPNGKIPTKTKAKMEAGKLTVSSSTTFNGPNGEMTTTSKTTWELSADGKTLTVKSTRPGRDGAEMTTESVYTKKS